MFLASSTGSLYGCISNSESSEECEKPTIEGKSFEFPKTEEDKILNQENILTSGNNMRTNRHNINVPEVRSNRVLKVSPFSTNHFPNSDLEPEAIRTSRDYNNRTNRWENSEILKKTPNVDYFSSNNNLPPELLQKPLKSLRVSRVVNIVPSPKPTPLMSNYHIPDQTIGIPTKNSNSFNSCHNDYSNSEQLNSITLSRTPHDIQESFLISKITTNERKFEPSIIHHPLISMNIPVSNVKPIGTRNGIADNRAPPLQQVVIKRENGERNKVKFSNTVTVAVVPVSLLDVV